ncbi:hypothetical protein FEM48_Zijuj06G0025500 [Ziziphus jujuba var. spinosa]|uniref:Uncharacterized protein n=1 Tax=Ziziphus jujuba var. spinosa TaxID=714518 RepID=A0A978V6N0_ZIZJJ|nr:hypothetical protein FEM48_Zijuj06G0025500 [Ziziphus jujuba var. spinosa]
MVRPNIIMAIIVSSLSCLNSANIVANHGNNSWWFGDCTQQVDGVLACRTNTVESQTSCATHISSVSAQCSKSIYMPSRFSPLLRNLHSPFASSVRMARAAQRAAVVPLNLTSTITSSSRTASYLGVVSHANGLDASSASKFSLFGRRFHALCGGEREVLKPLRKICASQRDYRKVRRRAAKSKEKELELNVSICIEEDLPDDPEILSIAEILRLNVPMAMKLAFEGLKDSKYKTRDTAIKDVGGFESVEISLLLCNDEFIRKLNKEWRDEDHATDVLSMSQHIPDLKLPILMLGDIVISVETAARQAEERGHTLIDEIRILMVHGLLHLLGFDHEISEEAEVEMEKEEEHLLKSLGWKGKGLIQSAYDAETNGNSYEEKASDGRKKAAFDFISQSSVISSVTWMACIYSWENKVPLIALSKDHCLTLLITQWLTHRMLKAEIIPSVDQLLATADVQKLIFVDTAEGVATSLRPYWSEATKGRANCVQAVPDMLEIVPPGTSKGSGVKLLLDHLQISPKEIMAIGDGENDVEMLELASLGIALSNGSEKTKGVADVIGASNDEDGVADAIYRYAF